MKKLLTIALMFSAALSFAQTTKTGDFHLDQDYKLSAKGSITLRCSDAKVFITGSDRTNVNVKIDREVEAKGMTFGDNEFTVDIDESSGNLTIRERSSGSVGIVGYYHERYTIKIEAPKGASLILDGDDGDYFVTNINGAIDADLDDADLELTGCGGDDFRFQLDDGDVKMDQGRGSLQVDGDDTNIQIRNAQFTKISAEIDDGDFIVETSLADTGDYYINTQDGKIQFTVTSGGGRFDIRHDDASVRADDSFSAVEESEERSRFTLANGNAKVDIRADDASVRLAKR
jgi:Putative adhesin